MIQATKGSIAGRCLPSTLSMRGYVQLTVEASRYALPVLPCLMVLFVAVLAQAGLPMVSLRHRHPLSRGRESNEL